MPNKVECEVCSSEINTEEGDVIFSLGMFPTAFCIWCYSSLTEMVIELNGFNDIAMLKQRIIDLEDE